MKKLRNENQRYNAWLHWDVTKRCNLDCEYCFGKITDPNVMVHPIDIQKMFATLNKTKMIFRISFTGGEPTLIPNFVDACMAITEKHYISFNTNLITKTISQFTKSINPSRVLHIHASLHFFELKKKNLLHKYAENFKTLRANGFNVYAESVAFPPIIDSLDELLSFSNDNYLDLSFAPFYGNFDGKKYPESYSNYELKLFGIKQDELSCFAQKGEICNAGYSAAVVFSNGNIYPCHQIKTKIGNIYEGIKFAEDPIRCPAKKCGCPLNKYDDYLYRQNH